MKRGISVLIMVALVATLAVPVAAFAKGPEKAKGYESAVAKGKPDHSQKAADKDARKAEKAAAKEERKAEKAASKAARGMEASEIESGSVDASGSTVASVTAGPGVSNAFTRITANLEKSLAKIAAGKKRQLPPGLVRVWLKFASWLGVDPSTMPGNDVGVSEEPTSTIEPTSTVEPTGTVVPTSTIEPTDTVVLTEPVL